jgi:hypothetical protein
MRKEEMEKELKETREDLNRLMHENVARRARKLEV